MLGDADRQLLYGLGQLQVLPDGLPLHPDVIEPFTRLRDMGREQGIELCVASGFRDFERQRLIWNRKVAGELPVLDVAGLPLDLAALSEREQVFAILRWSALPGASRHHWGTDMDVYDGNVPLESGYRLQLTTSEARERFGKLHAWLDIQIAAHSACGFFRPYAQDRGGVAPEPWHLSYGPRAVEFQRAFSLVELAGILSRCELALRETVLANLEEIHARFIRVPAGA